MPIKRICYFLFLFVFILGVFLARPTPLSAQAVGKLDKMRDDIDYFLGDLDSNGFLLWQYSGPPNDPLDNDQYSFFQGDEDCLVLKEKAGQYPNKFIGVNIHGLAKRPNTDFFNSTFNYLHNQCGVSVVRVWGTPDRTSDPNSAGPIIEILGRMLNSAYDNDIKLIVVLADYSNGTPKYMPGEIHADPTNWYAHEYRDHYLPFIEEVAGAVGRHDALYGFELANEPHCGGIQRCVAPPLRPYYTWARESSEAIRAVSGASVGIGQKASENTTLGDSPGPRHFKESNEADNINITSAHFYTQAEKDLATQARAQARELGKVFYIGEAGYAGEFDICSIDPEYHSLRPYPGCPKDTSIHQTAYMCGNSVTMIDRIEVSKGEGDCKEPIPNPDEIVICDYSFSKSADVSVDFSSADLPILGNTERVSNSVDTSDQIDDKAKVNDYVSWYLNGVINRAESIPLSPFIPEDIRKVIDLSGPLNKLLPQDVQWRKREETIKQGDEATVRHDQIAACTYSLEVPQICIPFTNICTPDIYVGGIPAPCYGDDGVPIIDIPRATHRIGDWANIHLGQNRIPPHREEYDDFIEYWAAYKSWRGDVCAIVTIPDWFPLPILQGMQLLLCGNDPGNVFRPDFWSNLYPYIPMSSTEDRLGDVKFKNLRVSGGVNVTDVVFESVPLPLYFAHTEEVTELGRSLQKTYKPAGGATDNSIPGDIDPVQIQNDCRVLDTRSNPGDKLRPDATANNFLEGEVSYDVDFDCVFSILEPSTNTCFKNTSVNIDIETRSPKVDEIWARLVGGSSSIFRRIYPKTGPDSVLEKIKDIPASTRVTFSGSGGVQNPNGEIYIPHIGSLQEYFLNGIQTALRPKGFGAGTVSGSGQGNAGWCELGLPPYCTIDYLKDYFNGDVLKAEKASKICQKESGGNPNAPNYGCVNGTSLDYSIGLFQINLLYHCPGAFRFTTDPISCTIVDDQKLQECEHGPDGQSGFYDPEINILKMVELSSQGTDWRPWRNSANACGIL